MTVTASIVAEKWDHDGFDMAMISTLRAMVEVRAESTLRTYEVATAGVDLDREPAMREARRRALAAGVAKWAAEGDAR